MWGRRAVLEDAQRGAVLPGEETVAAWHAYWILHEKPVVVETVGGEPVQIRGDDLAVAVDAGGIPALLVSV
jgi:hypothetical protein